MHPEIIWGGSGTTAKSVIEEQASGMEGTVMPQIDSLRVFSLDRREDESGVSGIGVVAYAVVFPSGRTIIDWKTAGRGMSLYDSLEAAIETHGHNGKTQFIECETVELK